MKIINILVKKDIRDLLRDKKALFGSILIPALTVPLIIISLLFLSSTYTPHILIVYSDYQNYNYSIVIENYLKQYGYSVTISKYLSNISAYDVIIELPKGFNENASSLNYTSIINVYYLANNVNQNVVNNVQSSLGYLSYIISVQKINSLSSMANIKVNPNSILFPINVTSGTITPSGSPSPLSSFVISILKLLAFMIFPVSSPAITYVVDSVLGERDRKTLELLLSSPTSIRDFLIAKVIMAVIIGSMSSISEILGLLGIYVFFSLSFNGFAVIPSYILIIASLSILLSIFISSILSVSFVLLIGGSLRSAQIIMTSLLALGFVSSILTYTVNLTNVNAIPLYFIPYVSLGASMQYAIASNTLISYIILGANTIAMIIIISLVSLRASTEKILLSRG